MNQDIGKPGWETESALSERLRLIQDYLTLTSGLLVQQVLSIRYGRPLQTKNQTEQYWEEFNDMASKEVTYISERLIELSADSDNGLRLRHPEDDSKYGKLCGFSFSLDEYIYLGSVKLGNDTKQWPILNGSQIFFEQTPQSQGIKAGNVGIGLGGINLREPTNSVVLDHGNNSQSHAANAIPHDGIPGIW